MKDINQLFRETHKVFWDKISQSKPEEISTNCNIKFIPEKNLYIVPFLKDNYTVDINLRQINLEKEISKSNFDLWVVLITYLYFASDVQLSGEFVSEQMLPIGNLFFKGVHALPKDKLIQTYISNEDEFIKGCLSLGARQTHRHQKETGFEFYPLAKFPIRIRLWQSDEEFSADANFLFDKVADKILSLDAILSLVKILVNRLIEGREKCQENR